MTRKAEQLAKMQEKAPSYQIGSGGKPVTDWTDVAGALAYAIPVDLVTGEKDKEAFFEAEMFALIHSPTLRDWPRRNEMIEARQFGEWRERAERLVEAQISDAMARRTGRGVGHTKLLLDGARAAMWPHLAAPQWDHIRYCVVAELRIKPVCETCHGTRHVIVDELSVKCPVCEGFGRERVSDRQRALSIKIDNANYIRHWRAVYQWTLNLVADSASAGEAQFQPTGE